MCAKCKVASWLEHSGSGFVPCIMKGTKVQTLGALLLCLQWI